MARKHTPITTELTKELHHELMNEIEKKDLGEFRDSGVFVGHRTQTEIVVKHNPPFHSREEIEKAFKEWKEAEKGKNGAEAADEDYAKKIGVEKNDLQDYRKVVESLQKIVNPETDLGVIEELKNLFSRIMLSFQLAIAIITVIAGIGFARNSEFQKNYDYESRRSNI